MLISIRVHFDDLYKSRNCKFTRKEFLDDDDVALIDFSL